MSRRFTGVRLRIAMAVAIFSLAAILAQSIALLMAFKEKEEEFIDDVLGQQISHSMKVWATHPELAFPNTPDMRLFRLRHDLPPPADLPPAVAALRVGNHEVYLDGREHHVAVRADDEARYILLYDVEDHEFRFEAMASIVMTGALLLSAALLLGSYFLGGQLAAQLERLAGRVARGNEEDLVEPGMADELLALASVLEAAKQQQAQALARERAFAANLSHELRTPLTAIRTDAELIAAADLPEGIVRRGNRIMSSVDRINATAASLLLLAREARSGDRQDVDLHAMLGELWTNLSVAQAGAAELQLDLPRGTLIHADPACIELVLRNLLENAQYFSHGGWVRCSLAGSRLCVADSGQGFSSEELASVFERPHVGRQGGHGLGLALVRHACEASGWHVRAANAAGGGGQVFVDFGDDLRAPPA